MEDVSLKEKLVDCFEDFYPFANECRFSSCTHTKESGCAVCAAVSDGKIAKTRHGSYIELFEQLKNINPWEIKKNKSDRR
jgi:ribosome biogenesis GTPase